MPTDKLKSEVTNSRPRDEKGHFIKIENPNTAKNPLEKFLLSHTGNYKDQEDLLDIRIGNPLGRIINLLEDIKKQKAFSFTLKGSLGIAGVVLAISLFGIFGGGKILCNKGVQTHIGLIKILEAREIYTKPVPVLSYLLELTTPPQKQIKKRTILINNDFTTIYLPFTEEIDYAKYNNYSVVATGEYNSCTRTLSVIDQYSIEFFSE